MASVPISIGTTATLVATISTSAPQTTWIHVNDAGPVVYFGPNSSVTTSNGVPFGAGSDLTFHNTYVGGTVPVYIYAICAGPYSGGVKVSTTVS